MFSTDRQSAVAVYVHVFPHTSIPVDASRQIRVQAAGGTVLLASGSLPVARRAPSLGRGEAVGLEADPIRSRIRRFVRRRAPGPGRM